MVIVKNFDELTNKEVWEIAMLRVAVFTIEQNIKEKELELDDFKATHYFIKKDNLIVAYARVLPLVNRVKVGRVCTDINYRNQGFQKAIMSQIIIDNNEIVVSAQEAVIDFYKKFKFIKTGNIYLEAGIKHQKMIFSKTKTDNL